MSVEPLLPQPTPVLNQRDVRINLENTGNGVANGKLQIPEINLQLEVQTSGRQGVHSKTQSLSSFGDESSEVTGFYSESVDTLSVADAHRRVANGSGSPVGPRNSDAQRNSGNFEVNAAKWSISLVRVSTVYVVSLR